MRANTVNFERGVDPKASMEIGGINFGIELDQIIDEWKIRLEKLILGKTITTGMRKILETGHKGESEKITKKVIKVDRIYDSHPSICWISQSTRKGMTLFVLVITTNDNERYSIELDQKIWINES